MCPHISIVTLTCNNIQPLLGDFEHCVGTNEACSFFYVAAICGHVSVCIQLPVILAMHAV